MTKRRIASGQWVDLGERYTDRMGPKKTFCASREWDRISAGAGVTRPDRIIANHQAASMVVDVEVLRHIKIPGHLPLRVTIKTELLNNPIWIMKHPAAFNLERAQEATEEDKGWPCSV